MIRNRAKSQNLQRNPGKLAGQKNLDQHQTPTQLLRYVLSFAILFFASLCNNLDCPCVVSLSCLYRYLPTRLESILLYFLISRMKWLSGELKAEHVSRAGSTPHICQHNNIASTGHVERFGQRPSRAHKTGALQRKDPQRSVWQFSFSEESMCV